MSSRWSDTFGTTKEAAPRPERAHSLIGGGASTKRLLQALRSMSPGGWSDNRYEQSRHQTGIAHICIHRAGEQLAQAEMKLFRKDLHHPDGKRPVHPDEPAEGGRPVRPYQLIELLEKPNQDDCFGSLMYAWNQQLDLTGVGLTWMVPNRLGVPMELYPIPTAIAIPQPAINPDYPDGYYRIQPIYPYGPFSSYPTPTTAVGAPIPAQWMLRFKYPHPLLRYDGYSPQTAMRLHLDETESIDKSRWYKMRGAISPSAVLNLTEVEGMQGLPEEEIERVVAQFEQDHQAPENAGKLFVNTIPGAKLEPWLDSTSKEMEYYQSWEQLVAFCMAGFGMTRPVAGMIEDANYATLFASLKQVHVMTLAPKCNRIAAGLTRHVAPFFGDNLLVEISCPRIDDHEILFAKIDKAVNAKCITKNQVLKLLDLPVTSEPWGEEIAGDPSPAEREEQEQQMQQAKQEMQMKQDAHDSTERPGPGPLGRGSLGPRKSLNGRY